MKRGGVAGVGGALGDAHDVHEPQRALLGDHIADVRVLVLGLEHVAAPSLGEPGLAGGQLVDVGVAAEPLEPRLDRADELDDLGQVGVAGGVGALAEVDQGGADQVGHLAQQRHPSAGGGGRLVHRRPGVDLAAWHPGAVEADPGRAPLPGNGVAVAGVVVGLDELPVNVGEVGDELLVQRLDQVQAQVGGDEPAGRDDDVVGGGAGSQFGQQVLVGGEDVVVDAEVGEGLEQRDGAVVDVVDQL
jgi:hypothetical protein